MQQRSFGPAGDSRTNMNQWAVIILVLFMAVGGVAFFCLRGYRLNEKDEADTRCGKCVRENCPINADDITNPERLCLALKATQDCECRGVCFSSCEKAISYNPAQCTVKNIC